MPKLVYWPEGEVWMQGFLMLCLPIKSLRWNAYRAARFYHPRKAMPCASSKCRCVSGRTWWDGRVSTRQSWRLFAGDGRRLHYGRATALHRKHHSI